MLKVVAKRLLTSIPLLFVVTFLIFLLVDLAPGDAARAIAGQEARPERVEEVRQELGLDDPVVVRYGRWLADAVRGDVGESLTIANRSVAGLIGERLPVTLSLTTVAVVLALVAASVLGYLAAIRPDGIVDRLVSATSSFAVAVPPFWIGLVLIVIVSIELGWLPAIGYQPMAAGMWNWLRHLLLPAIALAGVPAAELSRQLRASIRDVMGSHYIVAARARGLRQSRIVAKHALKNAMIPVVTVFGYRLAQMLGGTAVIESVFNMPGLGSLAVESTLARDFPLIQGVVLLSVLFVVVINLLVDLSYAYFNPRIRAA